MTGTMRRKCHARKLKLLSESRNEQKQERCWNQNKHDMKKHSSERKKPAARPEEDYEERQTK